MRTDMILFRAMKNGINFHQISMISILITQAAVVYGQNPAGRPPRPPQTQSPAARPRPKAATPQVYSAQQVKEGEIRFGSQCGFCHGKDAAGGESGTDLTRSELVAQDVKSDKLGPMIKAGRPSAGMPAFGSLGDEDLNAIVAFLHGQMEKFAAFGGGRRSVDPSDLATGKANVGRAYFNGVGKCSTCHLATGDLAGIGKRFEGLALLRRMLYPSGGPGSSPLRATFTLKSGQKVVAPVATDDEFSVTVLDPMGARQTYQKNAVTVKVEDQLSSHFDQLGKYTDADMHHVYAYLESLK